jgi:hypothetical protein
MNFCSPVRKTNYALQSLSFNIIVMIIIIIIVFSIIIDQDIQLVKETGRAIEPGIYSLEG